MPVIIVLLAVACICVLRVAVTDHDQIMHDSENEKY